MVHILIMDVPGGNDFAVLEDALTLGYDVTFCTSDLGLYLQQGSTVQDLLNQATQVVEVPGFDEGELIGRLEVIHQQTPFHGIVCLLDIRLMVSAQVAQHFGLRFLKPEVVALCRDKTAVRQRLKERGIAQPSFAQASSAEELRSAVGKIGYPLIIKPSDGYGSQNLFHLADPDQLDTVIQTLFESQETLDYGLGVSAKGLYSVEPYLKGQLIGVDVFSDEQSRMVLGVNCKKMYPPPSFAIAGSCFPSDRFDADFIQEHAFGILDAIDFNFGAAHIEAIVDGDQFYLVEINARLVSANIPFQMGFAFQRSIYQDLIHLHVGVPNRLLGPFERKAFSVIRWIVADRPGRLTELVFPEETSANIQLVVTFKETGDMVCPPLANSDRIGYVIATADTEGEATEIAESYIQQVSVRIAECINTP